MGERFHRLGRKARHPALRGLSPPREVDLLRVWLGHNQGPPLDPPVNDAFVHYRWRKAYQQAWQNPPLSILKLRLERAEAAGVSYREYMLVLLDTGRHLQAGDVAKRASR
jgi:hypothetical protein